MPLQPDGEASSDKTKESPKKEGKGSKSKHQHQQQQEEEEGGQEKGGAGGKDSRVAALPHVVKNVTLAELEGQVLGKEGVAVLAFYAGESRMSRGGAARPRMCEQACLAFVDTT